MNIYMCEMIWNIVCYIFYEMSKQILSKRKNAREIVISDLKA